MSTSTLTIPTRAPRRFLPDDLVIDSWEVLAPYFEDLKTRPLESSEALENWMDDISEVYAVLEEDQAWRYIKMTIDTTDEKLSESYKFFVGEVQPKISPFGDAFNRRLIENPFLAELDEEKYRIYLRGVKKELEIYREENVSLMAEVSQESQEYGSIAAAMSIQYKGEEFTMQQSSKFLKSTDRAERETVYHLIKERREQDVAKLNDLFTSLTAKRDQIAKNAGAANYRDYKFDALGRFDYTVDDCRDFHASIASEITPIVKQFKLNRKEALGYETLKPWDLDVDASGKPMLTPFEGGADLIDKSIEVFTRVRPFFGECLAIMKEMGHVDLESKTGKAPGGYNYPLYEIGVPFVFMNAVGSHRDLVTMMHEGGHAIHSFLTRTLDNTAFKSCPSEVAELASMAMELISMDHWDVFYTNEEELRRAKKDQLENVLSLLPWIAIVDKFQHWVYENPTHTLEERKQSWCAIMDEYSTGVVDYTGIESHLDHRWQAQLHIYEMPFYYIEYGMAQLGAIAVWRNYKENPEKALDQYQAALELGYTKSIGEIFEAAGIKFDFSQAYVQELAAFIKAELAKL